MIVTASNPPDNYVWIWADRTRVQPAHPVNDRFDLAVWRIENGTVRTRYVRGYAAPSPALPEVGDDWHIAAIIDRPAGSVYTLPTHIREKR